MPKRRSTSTAASLFLLACCVLSLLAPVACALAIEEAIWGFDGRHVVLGRFVPLTVLVSNPTPKPFDGSVALHKSLGMGRLGARLVERCYLGPFSSRWVQFYPYPTSQHETWVVSWGRGPRQRQDLRRPEIGPPVSVLLDADDAAAGTRAALASFPEGRFPTTVAATSGLRAVVLDHAPAWDSARRRAFVQWLSAGGRLVLLQTPTGGQTGFDDELAVLNDPSETFRIGTGTVERHPIVRAALDDETVRRLNLLPPPKTKERQRTQHWDAWTIESVLFEALQPLTRPKHNWVLIYVVSALYLVCIGPMHWWLTRRRLDYRAGLALPLVLVAVVGYGLFGIGRQGFGQGTKVHTLAYARPLNNDAPDTLDALDALNVIQWTHVFASRGAYYTIRHGGTHSLYTTAQSHESVNGEIRNGRDGSFVVDIPLNSSRSFVHHGTIAAPVPRVRVVQWPGDAELADLVLSVPESLAGQVRSAWALRGMTIAELDTNTSEWHRAHGADYRQYLDVDKLKQHGPNSNRRPNFGWDNEAQNVRFEDMLDTMIKPLLVDRLGLLRSPLAEPLTPDDVVELFILARSPQAFALSATGLDQEESFVLYHLSLREPEAADSEHNDG